MELHVSQLAEDYIASHGIVAYSIHNCTSCGKCCQDNYPTQLGYTNGNEMPIDINKEDYNAISISSISRAISELKNYIDAIKENNNG